GADRRLLGDAAHPEQVQRDLPVRDHTALSLLGHVLPDREPAGPAPGGRLAVAALARRRPDPGPRPRHDRRSATRHGHPCRRADRDRRRRVVGNGPADRATVDPRMTIPTLPLRVAPPLMFGSRRALRLIARNLSVYPRPPIVIVSGFLVPLFLLLSLGVG